MHLHNLKAAWRSLSVNRYYSLLHILGLGVSLATAVFIFIWVNYEKSFDQFNPDLASIYRVNNAYETSDGNNIIWVSSPAPIRKIALQNKQVEACVRIGDDYGATDISYQGKKVYGIQPVTKYVDQQYFEFFHLPLLKGDPKRVLSQSNQIVLSEQMAKKLFGEDDPIGKVVMMHGKDPFVVSGIARNMPTNTSLAATDIFLPLTFLAGPYPKAGSGLQSSGSDAPRQTIDDDYGNFNYDVYIRLAAGSHLCEIENQITEVYLKLGGPGVSGNRFLLQPMKQMHLIDENGSRSGLYLTEAFSWIGYLIILIACINYANLSTARALVRLKEVSIKKILGAGRKSLMLQFLSETALLLFFAICFAALLFFSCIPVYTSLTDQPMVWNQMGGSFPAKILLVILCAFLASAVYPALILSGFRPLQLMRGEVRGFGGKALSRKVLVIFQFAISVVIIFAAAVMIKQMDFIKTTDVGYNRSLVFTVDMPSEMEGHSGAVVQAISNSSAVAAVTTANANISQINRSSGGFGIPGRSDIDLLFNDMEVAPGFLKALGIQLTAGADFSGTETDSARFILNQTAVRTLALERPIGQAVVYSGRRGVITGVVRDFNFTSLTQKIAPLILYSHPNANARHGGVLYVRAEQGKAQAAIAAVQKIYRQYSGELPFKYDFLDTQYNSAYASFARSLSLLNIFSVIAVMISGLGLFALATYTAQAKTKEIGIRKVLGASMTDIVGLISRDFVLLVLLATLLALPVGSFLMHRWLHNFAYKTTIGPWVFIAVTLLMLLFTWVIIGAKALQAALSNPVKSLKAE